MKLFDSKEDVTALGTYNSYPTSNTVFFDTLDLDNLENFDITIRKSAALNKKIGSCKKLQWLSISGSGITHLPKEIGNLKNLETLYLSQNQIEELPKEISNCQKLRIVDLSFNKLSHITESIWRLGNLRILSVYQNPITESSLEKSRMLLPDCNIIF